MKMRYRVIAITTILIDVLVRNMYRWAARNWEPAWQMSDKLGRWWLFSGGLYTVEFIAIMGVVALLIPRHSPIRFTPSAILLALDFAIVVVFFDLGAVFAFDPILDSHLRILHLDQAYLLFFGFGILWFLAMCYRIKVLSAEFKKLRQNPIG